ncbi:MAG: glycoside hydrolase family 127 protein, partial [Oscillibacter sp.]
MNSIAGRSQHWQYNNRMAVKDQVFTPLYGVALHKGLFADVFQNNVQFLKQFRFEDMLYWFDEKLGIPTDGKPYRGHFEDNLKGQTASQYLMGAGNLLRWQDDKELHDGIERILDKLEQCEEPDGFMMPITKYEFSDHEYPHYTRIWLNYALIAAGLAGHERAFNMLRRWQDWFNQCPDLPIIKYTNLAFQGIVGSTYVWQTPIGKWEDVDVARKYYEEDWRIAQFMQKERDCIHRRFQPGYEPHPHGTEIESLEGYLDLYRATGAPYYLKAVLGARELYKRDWQHPGGGIVMCEFLDAFPGCGWIDSRYPYNELCCTAFWVNLNHRLHRLFPDVEDYMNEVERSIYNIAIANQDGQKKLIRYFAHMEGKKDKGGTVTCCCGVGTRLF